MNFWTVRNVRAVTGGQWVRKPVDLGDAEFIVARGLSTDTRAVAPGQAFLALRGERFDAHDFLDSAASAGASLLIIDRPESVPASLLGAGSGPAILRVSDTRRALGDLAAAYRRTLEGTKVIAVVGSNGKTTTVRLLQAALSAKLRGTASPKSFNNDVGVPLTLLAASPGDQFVVCEVGSNHPGETLRLAAIVQPDIAVVTSLGRDHAEFFESVEAVAREHAAIFSGLREGGVAVVPEHAGPLAEYVRPLANVVTFGTGEGASVRASAVRHVRRDDGSACLRLETPARTTFDLPLVGEHNAHNALAAIAVARTMKLDEPDIARGLAAARPADMRLNLVRAAGSELLVDCYNANPESMLAALAVFDALATPGARRVVCLGDMLEMGTHSEALHREVGAGLGVAKADILMTFGPAAAHMAEEAERRGLARRVQRLGTSDADITMAASLIRPGDFVLLKASRGIRLERVVAALGTPALQRPEAGPQAVVTAVGAGRATGAGAP